MNNFKSIFFSLLLTFALGAHKYYVSTTLIDMDKNNYYKVTVKAFYDDIELELGLDERVVNYDDEYSNLRDLFKTYFMDNFILIADKKKIKYNFVGFEKRNDLLQFYKKESESIYTVDELFEFLRWGSIQRNIRILGTLANLYVKEDRSYRLKDLPMILKNLTRMIPEGNELKIL